MKEHSHTWQEIISQPQVWRSTLESFDNQRATLESFLNRVAFDQLVVIGCGSTYYLAQAAAAGLAYHTRILARPLPSSELLMFSTTFAADRALLLAVSRSGTTTETLWAVEHFRRSGGKAVLAITCNLESTLARQADFVLAAPDAQEISVAQTRSFVSMFILSQALAATLAADAQKLTSQNRLPDALEAVSAGLGDLPKELGEDQTLERFFFLGGGPFYGLACEAMLKMKEMTLSYSEAYHPMELRHGPMSMVNEQTLVVGLLSDTGLTQEIRVLQDMDDLGARTLAIIEDGSVFADWHPHHLVELRSGLDEWARGALYLPPLQRLAYHRAVARGLDPDRPANLTAVVELEERDQTNRPRVRRCRLNEA